MGNYELIPQSRQHYGPDPYADIPERRQPVSYQETQISGIVPAEDPYATQIAKAIPVAEVPEHRKGAVVRATPVKGLGAYHPATQVVAAVPTQATERPHDATQVVQAVSVDREPSVVSTDPDETTYGGSAQKRELLDMLAADQNRRRWQRK